MHRKKGTKFLPLPKSMFRAGHDKRGPSDFDLVRLKWLDPCSDDRFKKKEPGVDQGTSSETMLETLVRLTDEIFDHLSVFEQFSEATSRGACADPRKKIDLPNVRACLIKAEQQLSNAYVTLRNRRNSFMEAQLDSLGIGEHTTGLKVHIGSAGYLLKHWLNIDAGGADLALNVNWGLPLPAGSAAFVYCAHLLEHLRWNDQAPVFVREIHRILAEGGTVRFVVPDVRKLLVAYAEKDRAFFSARQQFYPLNEGFLNEGVATLDYILLFCGAASQSLNFNHKFGYDSITLRDLLTMAGFREVTECKFQGSVHEELRVDDFGYNAQTKNLDNQHYSLFVEASK